MNDHPQFFDFIDDQLQNPPPEPPALEQLSALPEPITASPDAPVAPPAPYPATPIAATCAPPPGRRIITVSAILLIITGTMGGNIFGAIFGGSGGIGNSGNMHNSEVLLYFGMYLPIALAAIAIAALILVGNRKYAKVIFILGITAAALLAVQFGWTLMVSEYVSHGGGYWGWPGDPNPSSQLLPPHVLHPMVVNFLSSLILPVLLTLGAWQYGRIKD